MKLMHTINRKFGSSVENYMYDLLLIFNNTNSLAEVIEMTTAFENINIPRRQSFDLRSELRRSNGKASPHPVIHTIAQLKVWIERFRT